MTRWPQRVRHNVGLKLVSLLLALVLWAWRSSEANPDEERRFTRLPVRVESLASGLVLVDRPPAVDVVLYGPRRRLDYLQANGLVQPEVSLQEVTGPTWRTVDIAVAVPDSVQVRAVEPAEWDVEVDALATDARPLEVVAPQRGAPGLPRSTIRVIQVRGPRRRVNRVARVVAVWPGGAAGQPVQAPVEALDAADSPVALVDCWPREVTLELRAGPAPARSPSGSQDEAN